MSCAALCLLAVALLLVPHTSRWRIARHDIATTSNYPARVDDPLAAATAFDLLAACLRAGLPVASAALAVAGFAPEPLGGSLRHAADLLALGSDPASAWQDATDGADDTAKALGRMARRSARSGASLAAGVAELAEQRRAAAVDAAAAEAERAGVLIAGPLGLCFLPAFVCLGIVPVVIGLFGRVLSGGLW
jgi:pilus assembly protein TadC